MAAIGDGWLHGGGGVIMPRRFKFGYGTHVSFDFYKININARKPAAACSNALFLPFVPKWYSAKIQLYHAGLNGHARAFLMCLQVRTRLWDSMVTMIISMYYVY